MQAKLVKLIDEPWAQISACLAVGLILRVASFGDPNLFVDESYYLLVGHQMHLGDVPYVDIWDRKPLGIFLLYWVFASFRDGVLAYQVAAWIAASTTAFVIVRIATRWFNPSTALIAGLLYMPLIGSLIGGGGQCPVFYTLFTATGALLVFRYIDGQATERSLHIAMLLFGVAITFKQPAVFEAAFFGLVAANHHRQWSKTLLQMLLGAGPFAAIALWYYMKGYWPEFYDAMVTANTHRPMIPADVLLFNLGQTLIKLVPIAGTAIYAFAFCPIPLPRKLFALWVGAELAGFFSVPFMVEHYAIPLMVPLCIISASALGRRPAGPILVGTVAAVAVMIASPFAFARHRRSAEAFRAMAHAVAPIPPGRSLFIYDGPPLLYLAARARPPSVLAFPGHLDNLYEKDVSRIPTVPELYRLIATRPAAVVMTKYPVTPPDANAYRSLQKYVLENCSRKTAVNLIGPYGEPNPHIVYSGCT